MNCNEIRQHWMLFFDSEGDPDLHMHIHQHLADCQACADWFAHRQRLEQAVASQAAAVEIDAHMWRRVLGRAGLLPSPWRRLLFGAGLAAAVLILLLFFWFRRDHSELPREAALWHEKYLQGKFKPDLESTSDLEVDRFLRIKIPFRVHCPPRSDVNFRVKGAGMCEVKKKQAAYIVGHVGPAPVSILVLDQKCLADFPYDRRHLLPGQPHRCRENHYQMISGIMGGNVVVVIGEASPEALEKLLNAYGTYHEG